MKALIFLIVLGAAAGLLAWRVRKTQAEQALARRRALQRRKKQSAEALDQDMEVIWPVVIRPVSGKGHPGDEEAVEEPTMTAIEFEAPGPKAAQQGGSK